MTVLLLAGLVLFQPGLHPVTAQTGAQVILYGLDTSAFPRFTTYVDLINSDGSLAAGIDAAQVTVIEDGNRLPVDEWVDTQPGVGFVLALDPGSLFAYRDANAVTRYDRLRQAVQAWGNSHPDSLGDDLSLVPNAGAASIHLGDTASFLEALAACQPGFSSPTSDLATLAAALKVLSDPLPVTGMKPALLFMTSMPAEDDLPLLQNLTQLAVRQAVRVHVWTVAYRESLSTSAGTALKDLAIQTGGQVWVFSGSEPFPDLEAYLAPLRHAWQLAYTSAVRASGSHALSVQVTIADATVISDQLALDLDVLPPNPILLDPPRQLTWTLPVGSLGVGDASSLQPIQIIVDFPDGRPRPMTRTALFVDGSLVDENTAEPFDQFIWDIASLDGAGEHVLTVEALDSLGLGRTSLGFSVLVTIIQPPSGLMAWLAGYWMWLALGSSLVAACAASLFFFRRWSARQASSRLRGYFQPGLQGKRLGGVQPPLKHIPSRRSARQAEAFLVRMTEDGYLDPSATIPLVSPGLTLGSDPKQADCLLLDPSISPLHARLVIKQAGCFLSDENSISGTWVNCDELTAPCRLQHGDLVQLGSLSFFFQQRIPPLRPVPRVTPLADRNPGILVDEN